MKKVIDKIKSVKAINLVNNGTHGMNGLIGSRMSIYAIAKEIGVSRWALLFHLKKRGLYKKICPTCKSGYYQVKED